MKTIITWTLTDHLCRHCGGRILQSASGVGPTAGGNPLYRCADCGEGCVDIGPEVVCWCGMKHRNQIEEPAYRCLPFSILTEKPWLREAFMACGCDPDRGEVGIVMKRDMIRLNPEKT